MPEINRIIFRQLIESAAKNAGGTIRYTVCTDAHKQWRTVTIQYDEEIKNA